MAITEMLQALEQEATARFERIRQRAGAEAHALLKEAEDRRRPLREAALAKARANLVAERARRLTRARFAVRKEVALAQEAAVAGAYRVAGERLSGLTRLPSYPAAFRVLLAEALEGVGGGLVLHVRAEDEGLARAALAEAGTAAEVAADLATAGGLCLSVDGGRVVIDNTFEGRLAKAGKFLRPEVNRRLFARPGA
jgi:vacuolar-type H+-ATPase subunit E/Vma4